MTNNQNTTAFFDLIRHGEPAGGPMFRGSKDDPLSDTGWQQMNAAIRDDDQWDVIITSPLLRCRLFAEQLAVIGRAEPPRTLWRIRPRP